MSSTTGYDLSRAWFNFCFDNPEKIKPIHSAVFFFAVEHQNRLGGKEKFGFPSQMTMEAIGVKKYQTYGKALNDLEDWGFITFIERSKNQYSANIISINAPTKNGTARGKALDKATIKHGSKQGHSTGQGKDSIDKPLNQGTKEPSEGIPLTSLIHGKRLHEELSKDLELQMLISKNTQYPDTVIQKKIGEFCEREKLNGGKTLNNWRDYCFKSILKNYKNNGTSKPKNRNR